MAKRYDYIFSHDDPRRRRGSKDKITHRYGRGSRPNRAKVSVYVPETDTTYSSIAEAAYDLGIDASNISKVLAGRRRTAGGYHFERVTSSYEIDEVGDIGGSVGGSESPNAEIINKVEMLRNVIRRANQIIEDARKRKRYGFLEDVQELFDLLDSVLGSTGDNLIDVYSKVLDNMTDEELDQLYDRAQDLIAKAYEDLKKADDRLQGYADAFGVSSAEMEQYEDLIPEINATLARAHGNDDASNLWYAIRDAIQAGVDPEDLRDLLKKANDFFDNPGRGDSLRDIIREWEDSVYHGKNFEDMDNEDDDPFNW